MILFFSMTNFFKFGTYFRFEKLSYLFKVSFPLKLPFSVSGSKAQRVMTLVRAGLLSNLNSCGFSSKHFLLLNMEPLLKELCFLLCKLYIFCLFDVLFF